MEEHRNVTSSHVDFRDRFFDSIEGGNEDEFIESLLEDGDSINSPKHGGYTVLSCAVAYGCIDIVRYLVQKGANVNVENSDGTKPLHMASDLGRTDIVVEFLEIGAPIDSCDGTMSTPLHYAAKSGHKAIVKLLVERSANLDVKDSKGMTPVLIAVKNRHEDVEILVTNHHGDIVEILAESGADLTCSDGKGWTALHYAVSVSGGGLLKAVDSLVKMGAILDVKTDEGYTPLQLAAEINNTEALCLLIKAGADLTCLNRDKLLSIATVVYYGKYMLELLAQRGFDLDAETSSGDFPILMAFQRRCKESVKFLVNLGGKLDRRDQRGWTGLHFASLFKWSDIAMSIVERGGNVNAVNSNGDTALHLACDFSDIPHSYGRAKFVVECVELIKLLIENGADVNVQNVREYTPMYKAYCAGRRSHYPQDTQIFLKILNCLLNAGADINITVEDGLESVFDCFVLIDCIELIKLGIEHGGYFYPFITIGRRNYEPSFREGICQDVEICAKALVNKFNNKYLPFLYEKCSPASEVLPSMEMMKISDRSETQKDIEKSVGLEIQARGYCRVYDFQPIVLSMLCVRSILMDYRFLHADLPRILKFYD